MFQQKNLPECLCSKEDAYSKDPLKFWFIWQRGTLGQANSPECSEGLSWVAAFSVCRSAVDKPCSEGRGLENQKLILHLSSLWNLCKQPQSKHANLTSQENTSATFLWRIKDVLGFFPRISRRSYCFWSGLSHTTPFCLCCRVQLCTLLGTMFMSLILQRDTCCTERAETLSWCLSSMRTMGSLRPRGLKCHALPNFMSAVVFTLTDLMICYVCLY